MPNSKGRETNPFDAEMGELPGKMNRVAALRIAVRVLPSPALAEQKRPLVLMDDDVAPLPSTDTIGTRPNSPIDVADYMTAEQVADVIAGTKTLDVTQAVQNWIAARSEEHTSELQSLMRISYAVFCLKQKKTINSSKTTRSTNAKLIHQPIN